MTDRGRLMQQSIRVMNKTKSSRILNSSGRVLTDVEEVAHKFQKRRDNRLLVTTGVQKKIQHHFRNVSTKYKYRAGIVPKNEIIKFYETVTVEKDGNRFLIALGFRDEKKVTLEFLDRALDTCNALNSDHFYYEDFIFYHTKLEPTIPIFRWSLTIPLMCILLYYIVTPIVFCSLEIRGVCPESDDNNYHGVVSAVYFASATMSTVGYGDLSVFGNGENPNEWEILLGTVYMIVAVCVGVTALSAGSIMAFSPFEKMAHRLYKKTEDAKDENLQVRIRRIKRIKMFCIFMQFAFLNIVGFLLSRFFVGTKVISEGDRYEGWSWMTSMYWAVQTTLTVGYGDLTMDDNMRWFQIFYLVISTILVGDALGKLADLNVEIKHIRQLYAFERREVSKSMIDEFQAYEHDGKIDQYEFLVQSLLTLDKISVDDITPIMDKFTELAGDDETIDFDDIVYECDVQNGDI